MGSLPCCDWLWFAAEMWAAGGHVVVYDRDRLPWLSSALAPIMGTCTWLVGAM